MVGWWTFQRLVSELALCSCCRFFFWLARCSTGDEALPSSSESLLLPQLPHFAGSMRQHTARRHVIALSLRPTVRVVGTSCAVGEQLFLLPYVDSKEDRSEPCKPSTFQRRPAIGRCTDYHTAGYIGWLESELRGIHQVVDAGLVYF